MTKLELVEYNKKLPLGRRKNANTFSYQLLIGWN